MPLEAMDGALESRRMGPGGQQPLTDCQNSSSPHFFLLAASVDATVRRRILVPLAWQVSSFSVSASFTGEESRCLFSPISTGSLRDASLRMAPLTGVPTTWREDTRLKRRPGGSSGALLSVLWHMEVSGSHLREEVLGRALQRRGLGEGGKSTETYGHLSHRATRISRTSASVGADRPVIPIHMSSQIGTASDFPLFPLHDRLLFPLSPPPHTTVPDAGFFFFARPSWVSSTRLVGVPTALPS